jgi:hypothetical protein
MLAGIEFRMFIFPCPISLCNNMVLRQFLITLCDNRENHALVVGSTNSADRWMPTSLSVAILLIKNFLEPIICIYFNAGFYDQILSTRSEVSAVYPYGNIKTKT